MGILFNCAEMELYIQITYITLIVVTQPPNRHVGHKDCIILCVGLGE